MIAPMLEPPTKSMRHSGLAQCAHHAEMREAARAAAGENQAHTAARDETRGPPEIGRTGDVMVLRHGQGLEPAARGAGDECAFVQQRELDARAACGRGADGGGPGARVAARTREREDQVRLPAALAQPASLPRTGRVDDVLVLLLEPPEPGGGMRLGAHVPDQLCTAGTPQLLGEPRGEIDRVDVIAARHERENSRVLCIALSGVAAPEAARAEPGHGECQLARACGGLLEQRVGQEQELGVAQRGHGGAMGLAEQPAGLADQLAALDLGLETGAGRAAYAEPPARQQIYSLGYGARFEQRIAGRQRKMHGAGRKRLEGCPRHVLEVDAAFETVDGPAQFLRSARRFFLQGHGRFSGRAPLIL